jgi:hypothetical protein
MKALRISPAVPLYSRFPMQRPSHLILAACFLLLLTGARRRDQNEPYADHENRYTAVFVDGTRVEGGRLSRWERNSVSPRINGRALLDEKKPVRWLKHDQQREAPRLTAIVEFFGGDVLPGRVIEFRGQNGESQLVVEPDAMVRDAEVQPARQVIVETRWVRRIVWQPAGKGDYQPGTLLFSDGRKLRYRSLKFSGGSIELLTDEGRREVSLGEVAELHLPRRDPWEVYYEQLAVLSPKCTARLVQLQMTDGLRVTTSTDRMTVDTLPGGRYFRHVVRPAWSVRPLVLDHPRVGVMRFFMPHEVPLSAILPERIVRRSVFGGSWQPRQGHNVRGGPLRSGGRTYGWGLGVQAHSEIYYALPSSARAFRSHLGLDESVGSGGCVRALVYANEPTGKPLFRSDVLVGSTKVIDTKKVWLKGHKQIVLVADAAHEGRPEGADPLDVRDALDWLEPVIELEFKVLRKEVARRVK